MSDVGCCWKKFRTGEKKCVSVGGCGMKGARMRINDKMFISTLERVTAGDVCEMQRSAPIQPCGGGIISYSACIEERDIWWGMQQSKCSESQQGDEICKSQKGNKRERMERYVQSENELDGHLVASRNDL